MDTKTSVVPIEANIEKDSFSSNVHGASVFAEEAKDYAGADYEIPDSYGIDTLKLMPVNVNTVYMYWEITDKLIQNYQFATFALRLLEIDGENEKEILGFYFKERVSGKYANAHMPSKRLVAIIGGIDSNGRFTELLRSNKITMPSDSLCTSSKETWMSKQSEWTELIKASVSHFSHAKSSISLIKEIEFLKKYGEKAAFGQSSFELPKKD